MPEPDDELTCPLGTAGCDRPHDRFPLDRCHDVARGAELVLWADRYGEPEEWVKRAQAAHARAERLYVERDEARAALAALVSDHDGTQAVWVCDRCGQPIGKDGRCNSGAHVGPGESANGMAVATTDLVAERDRLLVVNRRHRDALVQIAAEQPPARNTAAWRAFRIAREALAARESTTPTTEV